MKRYPFLGLVTTLLLVNQCTNIGLSNYLEKPGTSSGNSSSQKLYAFITSQLTLGDMSGFTNGGCTGNGFARADCACTDLAIANGLMTKPGGLFRAWLSGQMDDMTCRLQGFAGNSCGIPTGSYTWYNTNEEQIAASYGDLFDGALAAGLKYTETRTLSGATSVWTGTDANGLRSNAGGSASNCTDWTITTTAAPVVGTVGATNASWSNNTTPGSTCGTSLPVYCFGIP